MKAGGPTDAVIDSLVPLLEQGDIIIDGGNALWTDTIRREKDSRDKGCRFIGSGVSRRRRGRALRSVADARRRSGGVEGARADLEGHRREGRREDRQAAQGAAPGKPVKGGVPCTTYIGPNGAGHYVKMVHNGIEYGDMQMICEAYAHARGTARPEAGRDARADLRRVEPGRCSTSFLIEITADILQQKDPVTEASLSSTSCSTPPARRARASGPRVNALDMGVPAPTHRRGGVRALPVSASKEERVAALEDPQGPAARSTAATEKALVEAVRDALYCSKICSYAQGFQLMREAQKEYNWKLDFGEIAQIWRGGCIIRARFLQKITEAYAREATLANLLLDPYFRGEIERARANWRQAVATAATHGMPAPAFISALAYYDGYRSERLPANLLQAQRDYFGAHTYERVDAPRGQVLPPRLARPEAPAVRRPIAKKTRRRSRRAIVLGSGMRCLYATFWATCSRSDSPGMTRSTRPRCARRR